MEYPPAPGSAAGLFPFLLLLLVISVLPSPAAGSAPRVYESGEGRLRISVVAVTVASTPEDCLSAESIGDFTSPSGICRSGDALLEVDFFDRPAMRELRFPLRYSELRSYLLEHPLAYQEGTAEERAIRLIADLARHLRIEMRESPGPEEKP